MARFRDRDWKSHNKTWSVCVCVCGLVVLDKWQLWCQAVRMEAEQRAWSGLVNGG